MCLIKRWNPAGTLYFCDVVGVIHDISNVIRRYCELFKLTK